MTIKKMTLKTQDRAENQQHLMNRPELSRDGLAALHAAIQQHTDCKAITGAVTAISYRNQVVWHAAHGVADVESGSPMRTDHLFRMMSSTKPVTAVAVLMLMEEGRLGLEDAVSRFIPSFKSQRVATASSSAALPAHVEPASREITIRDLLTHTSGLSSIGVDLSPGPGALVSKIERMPTDTLADYVSRLGAAVLDFQPGSQWRYSPFDAFDVLLRIVEIVSEIPGDRFLKQRIFEPLGMRDTWFNVPPEQQHRVLALYAKADDCWLTQPSLLADLPPDYISGAGGLFSTAMDFLQFELMLLNQGSLNGRTLLKPETVALMKRNQVGSLFADFFPPLTGGMGFGLGVGIVEDASNPSGGNVGAFGWGGAYGTETWADPKQGIAVAVLIQQPIPTVKAAFQQAIRTALAA